MQKNSPLPLQALALALLFALLPSSLHAEESTSASVSTVAVPGTALADTAAAGQARGEGRSLNTMAAWIGLDIDTALRSFGTPSSIFPLRGKEAWQDDVVFAWDDLELFWFQNRVWQLRFFALDSLNRASGLKEVRAVLGEPLFDHGSSWIYQVGGFAWPLRLRVDFSAKDGSRDTAASRSNSDLASGGEDALLLAFYLYRADF